MAYIIATTIVFTILGVIPPIATIPLIAGLFIGDILATNKACHIIARKNKTIHDHEFTICRLKRELKDAKASAELWEYKVRYYYERNRPTDDNNNPHILS